MLEYLCIRIFEGIKGFVRLHFVTTCAYLNTTVHLPVQLGICTHANNSCMGFHRKPIISLVESFDKDCI